MLSPLQQRVATIVAELPEADGFALAGGGALIARGDIDRATRDLDYFATEPGRVLELLPALTTALTGKGLSVAVAREADGFARIVVTDADASATTEVDLASDCRLLPVEATAFGPTLAAEELAIDKVLAIFDRAEPRDFADLVPSPTAGGWTTCSAGPRTRMAASSSTSSRGGSNEPGPSPTTSSEFPQEQVPRVRAAVERWKLQVRLLHQSQRGPGRDLGR